MRLFIFLVSCCLFSSCMKLGLNFKHKTPAKAAKLPVFTERDSLMGANNTFRSCFDVTHYDIHLNINPKTKSIKGFVTTSFKLVNDSKMIQLDLDPRLTIDSIIQNEKRLNYKRKFQAIFIDLVSAENTQQVTVYYHGVPQIAQRPPWSGGLVWKKDKNGKTFAGVACEGEGTQVWLAVKNYLGDEPDSADMYFTVPADLVAVSNGLLISEKVEGNEKEFHWKTVYPINPYNITFYLGDYKTIQSPFLSGSGKTVMRTYYVLPQNVEKAKTHFAQSEKILQTFESIYGNYPWQKETYKLVESPYAGMEHQTAIAYGTSYKNLPGYDFDYIILHETAHEWWGNSVSVADFSDIWIHEGIATYSEALYVEKTRGYKAYLAYMNYIQLFIMNKKPVVGPRDVHYWNYKDGDPYGKGAAMLHALRNELGDDDLFFKILKTFYVEKSFAMATTEDFILHVNQMCQCNLTPLFEQYLYHREVPYLKWYVETDKTTGKANLVFKLEKVVTNFSLTLEVQQGEEHFNIFPGYELKKVRLPYAADQKVFVNTTNTYLQDGFTKKGFGE